MKLLQLLFRDNRLPLVGIMLLSLCSAVLSVGVIAFINLRLIGVKDDLGLTLISFIGLLTLLLACAGVQSGWRARPGPVTPPLPAIAYLVEHCGCSADGMEPVSASRRRSDIGRVGWMLELMERLEQQRMDEAARGRAAH